MVGHKHYPQVLRESDKRPDAVLVSESLSASVLVELTVPWEDRMETINVLKTGKYDELVVDLESKGHKVCFFAVEVGARGLPGRSGYTFLRDVGLSSKEKSKCLLELSKAAEEASQWIWEK